MPSLVALAAGFEISFALHVAVERIGRFIQVRYESEAGTSGSWERTAMALRVPGGGVDPLFIKLFLAAAVVNLLAGVWIAPTVGDTSATALEQVVLGIFVAAHAAVILRWLSAARYAGSQRARELTAFQELLR